MMEKLLAIITLSQNLYGRWLFRRMLSGIMVVFGLITVTAMMIGAVVIGGFYGAYLTMLHYNYDPRFSLMIVEGAGALTTLLFLLIIILCLRHLRDMPRKLFTEKLSPLLQENGAVAAFMEGFNRPTEK